MITRRGLLRGLSIAVAAPAIVRAASLMPVKALAFLDDGTFMPTYPGSVAAELAVITRKAFIPRVFVQIYQATPLMSALQNHQLGDDITQAA